MLQGGGIDPRAQPRETLRQYGSFHADPRDPDELLELVGLSAVARTRYRRLSGGERQRLGLALALVGRPEVVILDEPTAGMDPEARATTRAIVADLRAEGAAILMTSHDLTDVERLADRIYVLVAGRIVAAGTPAELRAGVTARLRFRLDRPLGTDEVAGLERALGAIRPGLTVQSRRRRRPLPARGSRTGRRARRRPGRLVRRRRAAHRRAPDLRWEPRGRVPRARRGKRRIGRGRAVSRPAPLVAATLAQTGMELRLTARRGENVLVTIVIPVVVLLFFASVAILPTGSGVPVDFILPGTLALAVIAASLVNLGIATAYERNYGVLKRLGGSPLTRAGLLTAKMLAVLAVEIGQVVLLVAIAVAVLGWRPGPGASAALFVLALLLGTLTFGGLGLLLAGALRAEATLAFANGLFIAFLLLGGIVIPVAELPGAARHARRTAAGGGPRRRVPCRARVGGRGGRRTRARDARDLGGRGGGARVAHLPLGVGPSWRRSRPWPGSASGLMLDFGVLATAYSRYAHGRHTSR